MPIQGLTNRSAMLPELGVLRKGGPKTDPKKPGPDLSYFRFDTTDKEAQAAFLAAFGKEPRRIEIKMPFPTLDENFEAWCEEYVAGGLKHRCDGKKCVLWLDSKTGEYRTDPKDCPGGCKEVGRLKIIIPALQRFAYVTVTTTSIWDIMTIHQNLQALEVAGGTLRGIPMILCRREKEISTPVEGGKRARRKKWLICIEAEPDWVKLYLDAMHQASLAPMPERLMLKEGQTDDEDPEPGAPGPLGLAIEPDPEESADDHEELQDDEKITPDQHSALKSIIAQLRRLEMTNEKLADDIGRVSGGHASSTSELTSDEAGDLITEWQRLLIELKEQKAQTGQKAAA